MQKRFLLEIYGGLLGIIILLGFGFANLPQENMRVSFLDVGQGDAILIQTPQQQRILVDAGPVGNILTPLGEELGFFEKKINLVIITHPDADHIAGFAEVLRRYEVENILLTGIVGESAWYHDLLQQIAQQKIHTIIADEKTDFDFGGGVIVDTLWPLENLAGKKVADTNATSITTRITFGKTSLLLTGDLDIAGEKDLLATGVNLSADVLKLGHHGSHTSNSEEWLAAVNPEIAVVSAGKDNQFGHPHADVIERLKEKKILSTIDSGNLDLASDGKSWQITSKLTR
jgi:beta-lactamase superfamily II metal-dependent hydrolase